MKLTLIFRLLYNPLYTTLYTVSYQSIIYFSLTSVIHFSNHGIVFYLYRIFVLCLFYSLRLLVICMHSFITKWSWVSLWLICYQSKSHHCIKVESINIYITGYLYVFIYNKVIMGFYGWSVISPGPNIILRFNH